MAALCAGLGAGSAPTDAGPHAGSIQPIAVAPGSRALRVRAEGTVDFALTLRFGAPPGGGYWSCRREASGRAAVCEQDAPRPGTWYARVLPLGGRGPIRLSAAVSGAAPETCAAGCPRDALPLPCPPRPTDACRAPLPRGATLRLRRSPHPERHRLAWRWRGLPSPAPDFGNPLADTDYRLCVYDDDGGGGGEETLRLEVEAPAGLPWRARPSGLVSRSLAGSGLAKLRLTSRRWVKLRARASGFPLPPLPLAQKMAVRVQLVAAHGACWDSRFSFPPRRNDLLGFADRSDL